MQVRIIIIHLIGIESQIETVSKLDRPLQKKIKKVLSVFDVTKGHMARSSVCAAKGKKCKMCGKIGHFSVVCWNNKTSQKEKVVGFNKRSEINVIKQETFRSSSEEDVFHVEERTKILREIELLVENVPIHFIIDSGAGVNIIDSRSCEFFLEKTKKKISQTDMKLYAYGSEVPLDLKGEIECNVAYRRNTVLTKKYIVKRECSGCLLGRKQQKN